MKISINSIILLIFILGVGGYFYYHYRIVKTIEQPKYRVLHSNGFIEIREYSPYISASVRVEGSRSDAASKGFKILAAYIFGGFSKKSTDQASSIAMTAPVSQYPAKIAMTSPVREKKIDNNSWVIEFSMPSQYTLQTLPQPSNSSIIIKKNSQNKYIVIRFSGSVNSGSLAKKKEQLARYMRRNEIIAAESHPIYAFYDPPWTLPFLRRNEIMFRLKK